MEMLTDKKIGNLIYSASRLHFLAIWANFDTFHFQIFY
jgi:hypothetical protein